MDTLGETRPEGGELLAAVATMVVGVYADHLGRGPTKARAYLNDDVMVCLLEDTMTKAERTLVASGHQTTVLALRATFQEMMGATLSESIEQLTGRRVLALIGGSSLSPDLSSELFLLEGRRSSPRENGRALGPSV